MSTKYFINYLKYTIIIISIIIFFSLNFISQLKIEKFNNNKDWIDLTKINIDKILSKNIIFVDITADWCATCQFNKFNVLNSRLIKKTFIENDVIKIRGDWTKSNKQIEKYLNDFNRFGIPFNAIYSINYPNGIVLSEILTSSEIIDTINLIKKDNK